MTNSNSIQEQSVRTSQRSVLAVWMALHVAISIGQPRALLAHAVIFGFVAYLLFSARASTHFAAAPKGGSA